MKFRATTTALSLLALAIITVKAQINMPLFACDAPLVGGCCNSFNTSGIGIDCKFADLAQGDGQEYVCNDNSAHIGQPACCQPPIRVPPGTHAPVGIRCTEFESS